MKHRTASWILLFTSCAFVAGAITYANAPEHIPIHWNINGEIDGYGPNILLLLFPLLIIVTDSFLVIVRKIDPKKANYNKFSSSYRALRLMLALMFCAIQLLYFCTLTHPGMINIGQAMMLLIGCSLCVAGNLMPRFRRNYFTGIKTPWTLGDDRIWYKTHRFAGRMWFGGGLLLCISACFSSYFAMLIILAAILVIPVIYSYWLYQTTLKKGETL